MIQNPKPIPAKLESRVEKQENGEIPYKAWCCGHPGCNEELARVTEEWDKRAKRTKHLNRDGTVGSISPMSMKKHVKLADKIIVLRSSPFSRKTEAGNPESRNVPGELKRHFCANQSAHKTNVAQQNKKATLDENEVKLSRIVYKELDFSFGEEWFENFYLLIYCPLHCVANVVKSVE